MACQRCTQDGERQKLWLDGEEMISLQDMAAGGGHLLSEGPANQQPIARLEEMETDRPSKA